MEQAMVAHPSRRLQRVGLLLLAVGCSSAEGDFTSGLVEDPCDQFYPACNSSVGCILTNTSYTTGSFPGTGSFLIETSGPSTVQVHFFLLNPTGAGSETTITWFESGCTSSFQQSFTGKVLVAEAEAANGEFTASQQLSAPGDHLITYSSDTTSQFLVKVVIIPTS
jgi:hypothetical protein